MRPVPIPDEIVWEGGVRKVIAPPGGDLTNTDIAPCEAVIDQVRGMTRFNMRILVEPKDLENLENNPFIWVSILAPQLPPWQCFTEHEAFEL